MVFLMQVRGDFLFIIIIRFFFFPYKLRRFAGDIKKVLTKDRIEASFFTVFSVFRKT